MRRWLNDFGGWAVLEDWLNSAATRFVNNNQVRTKSQSWPLVYMQLKLKERRKAAAVAWAVVEVSAVVLPTVDVEHVMASSKRAWWLA